MPTESSNAPGHLTHPSREAWMEYLFDESPRHRELDLHLKQCPVCQRDVARWRGAMSALDAYDLPVRKPRRALPGFKWAAAAALVLGALGLAFGLGRTAATASVRAEMQTALDEQRQTIAAAVAGEMQRVLGAYAEAAEGKRVDDQQTVLRTIQTLDAARRADILTLRKDLETVAVFTDDSLRKTEEQLFQLAASSQTGPNPEK